MPVLGEIWSGLHRWLGSLMAWTEAWAATPYGDWALFVLAFCESSFFPLPPDILLIALSLGEPTLALRFAMICTAGSVLGGIAGYGIGYFGGRPLLLRWFPAAKVKAVEQYYDRYNAWATAAGALTPLPYKLFAISAGAFAINLRVFALVSLAARGLRFFAIGAAIQWLGAPARALLERYLNWIFIAVLIVVVVGFWVLGRGVRKTSAVADRADVD